VRVIAATNRNLTDRVASGEFREDLYFRLAVIPLTVPSLRDRTEDTPLLVEHFAAQIATETSGKRKKFTSRALDLLRRYPFPGNVRELRNLVERLMIMSSGASIGHEDVLAVLPREDATAAGGARLSDAVREFEKKQIEAALQAEGTMTKAATRLGLERSHLYKKMKRLGWRPESLDP
jgi:two-component system nitrogen regulation response regulator NtrX